MRGAAFLIASATTLALSTCSRGSSYEFSLLAPGESVEHVGEVAEVILEYARSYGVGVLPPTFTYRGPAAVSSTRQMLLRSHADCAFAVLDLETETLTRTVGRCGDGPHESRAIAGAGLFSDTIVFADTRGLRLRFMGRSDTVARQSRLNHSALQGARSIHSLTILSDSTAFVTLAISGLPGDPVDAPLLGFVDLRDGSLRPVPFHEPEIRVSKAREADRYYHACTHREASTVVLENNGPAEVLGLDAGGAVRWAIRTEVRSIDPGEALEEGSRSAAFQWNRIPVRPACSGEVVFSRILTARGTDPVRPLGHVLVVDYQGDVRLNLPFAPTDTLLAHATWFADDSLLYIATTQAVAPRVLAFRVRSRRDGEIGVFSVPDSIRTSLDAITPEPEAP